MANAGVAASCSIIRLRRSMANSTSGGSRETDVNEFAVNPSGTPPASRVVTTVTPVTKHPRARRSVAVSGLPSVSGSLSLTGNALAGGRAGRHAEAARLFEAGNPAALAAAVRAVLADPESADRMGRAAFDAAADYTWARRAERIERLLDDVFEEARA